VIAVDSFWGSDVGLIVVLSACFGAVFLLMTFLAGTRARARRDRSLARRLGRKPAPGEDPTQILTQWVPGSFAHIGQRLATASGFSGKLDERLEQAGLPVLAGEFVALTTFAALGGGLVAAIFFQNVIFVLLSAGVFSLIPYGWLLRALRKRQGLMIDQLADTLAILASSLRAGYSFLQALDTVSKEISEPSAGEFQRVVAEIRLGRPIDDALLAMADRVDSQDLRWAVIAINVQRQVGGNLAEVLDIVAKTVRERAYLRRQVNVLSAEGKFSVVILASLPFLILLYLSIVNPGYIEPLFTTTIGLALLAVGGTLMGLGIWVMTRIVKIDV